MQSKIGILVAIRRMVKLHDALLKEACREEGLTGVEAAIVGFLHNNPQLDTAADIVELRLLPKGNVSQGVDSLLRRGLLRRSRDQEDRRRLHLALTEEAAPVVAKIQMAEEQFLRLAFQDFTEEERRNWMEYNGRIAANAAAALEGKTER